MKFLKKPFSIMMTIILVIGLLPNFVLAEDTTRKTESFVFNYTQNASSYSNADRVDFGYTVTTADRNGEWNHLKSPLYFRTQYPAFAQIDLSGYEEVLKNVGTTVHMNLARHGSYSIEKFDIYLAADNCDQISFADSTTFNHTIAVSSGFTNVNRPLLFNRTDATAVASLSSGELSPANLISVLDENPANSKIALYMKSSTSNARLSVTGGSTNFNITYDESQIDNYEYVNELANKITWDMISTESQDNVSSNLNLPSKFYGADVTWVSSNEDVISSSGEVTVNPDANSTVTLSAQLKYTNFKGDYATASIEPFTVKVLKPKYDYTAGTGTYYDGNIGFKGTAGSSYTHVPAVTIVEGVGGKDKSDLCYKLQDAEGNKRFSLNDPGNTYEKRDVLEFSIYIPSDGYGLHVIAGDDSDSDYFTTWKFKKDGIWLARLENGAGRKVVSYDGDKWHHIAVVSPGVVKSDASGIEYDTFARFYVDGVEEYQLDLAASNPTPKNGFKSIVINGLCPVDDYKDDGVWDTVACYLDNVRWTNNDYVAKYNTLSSLVSDVYDVDGDVINVMTTGATVADLEANIEVDEDAVVRVYNADGNFLDDKSCQIADGYKVVIADTNGTTTERTYAYYDIRVIEGGTVDFDVSVTKDADGNVDGAVKLYNNTDAAKAYDVYLVVYNSSEAVTVLDPVTLGAESGYSADVEIADVAFEKGNIVKLLVWEKGSTTPAIKCVEYK